MGRSAVKSPSRSERPAASKCARYEDDFYTCVNEQVALLRAGRLAEIDAGNIAEELSDVGKGDWAALETHLQANDFPKERPYKWDDILERPFEMNPER